MSAKFKSNRWYFFFQITTQLQYIEDTEPVVDELKKQTKGATKLSNQSNKMQLKRRL